MRVLRYLGPRRVEIGDLPRPAIGDGEVLVQMRACGICATDIKTYVRGHPLITAGAVLGHEMSGVIAESQADGWRAGERVVVAPYVPCGVCRFCRRGQHSLCSDLFGASVEPGGFSEYVRAPGRIVRDGLIRIPAHMDFAAATLAEPLACCYHGLEALSLQPGDSVLIIGDGPMGLLQASAARAMGATLVVVAGLTPERLQAAESLADHVINVAERDLGDAVKALSAGAGMDHVMVSVGAVAVAEQAMGLVRRGGTINLFGGLPGGSRMNVDPNRIHYDEVRLLGTFGFAPTHFRHALDALAGGAVDAQKFITRRIALDGVEGALADGAQYQGIKTVVEFEG
ncbi:MAG: alcohol dehydrogenase catalytic domain-containing protein [Chloroflexi bacterium]|nr:alcohol dehydrogenase catalytic domain-containing protein [Chloroflexota bacterium]